MESEEELRSPLRPGRAGRALALMAVSILVIGVATIAYAHPQLALWHDGQALAGGSTLTGEASYRLAAIDFVSASTGWVVAELPNQDFAVLNTVDGGSTWTRQLSGPGGDIGEYAHFFDSRDGVLVLLGPQAVMFQTHDGGKTWNRDDLQVGGGYVRSADFVNWKYGWLLVQMIPTPTDVAPERLYRTSDGGVSWTDESNPVLAQDRALRVVFADSMRGWLYSVSSGPYAYATADGGSSWHRAALPAPPGGWPTAPVGAPAPEDFFVAARPTMGQGVVATVVPIAPPKGRSADGGTVLGYPPLTIRAFDGGGSVTYVYTTYGDETPYRYTNILSEAGQVVAPIASGQVELSSLDGGSSWKIADVPSAYGALGFIDALDWWWIGAGEWATSSDGGVTWSGARRLGVLTPLPGSLQMLDGDHAWFGAMVGTRPMLEMTPDGGYEWLAISLPPLKP
jgi:photosystem II stability/assembly factor-like uncharacterized protein